MAVSEISQILAVANTSFSAAALCHRRSGQTPFFVYFQDTRWLTWLLGPATIAFAYPIYTQRMLLRRYPITLMIGVLVGFGLGILSSMLLARIFHLPPDLARSSLPRSVSTPFALLASKAFVVIKTSQRSV
jgi:putative effector of murein hydrolase